MVSLYQLWNYLSSFFIVCTSSIFNFSQCLQVWNYIPGYTNDMVRFYSHAPYQMEKQYVHQVQTQSIQNLLQIPQDQ